MQIDKDLPNKKMTITRMFNANPEQTWAAWTEAELLDQWWAPKPWKAETKNMDFSNGGHWLYAMVSPEGAKHWCRVDFGGIEDGKRFTAESYFTDEDGHANPAMPKMHWDNSFAAADGGTLVTVVLSFGTEADMTNIIAMGFEGGFSMGMSNLDECLANNFGRG